MHIFCSKTSGSRISTVLFQTTTTAKTSQKTNQTIQLITCSFVTGCTEYIQESQSIAWKCLGQKFLLPLVPFATPLQAHLMHCVTETWRCALALPADCVTLPDCTQVTHFSLPAVPEVTAKVSREQKRCFVIQNLDSYQLINLGETVTTKHGTVQSSHTHRCLQE